jgi:5-formyltetrahydrofolate cyclo-ligase
MLRGPFRKKFTIKTASLLNKEQISTQKALIRKELRKERERIPPLRREQASIHLLKKLIQHLEPYTVILSFVSFGSEIETHLFNHYLAHAGKLHLPKMEKNGHLSFYQTCLGTLIPNSNGILEPDPAFSIPVELDTIEVILVPGLGFDQKFRRIGYGKGYYDRFLQANPHILSLGIGFLEQLIDKLPCEKNDQAVSRLFLF